MTGEGKSVAFEIVILFSLSGTSYICKLELEIRAYFDLFK
jgi:hypothetical protein